MKEQEKFIDKHGPALCALNAYISVGISSREYAARCAQNNLMEEYKKFNYKDSNDVDKFIEKYNALEVLTYQTLFVQMYLLIEDTVAILDSLTKDLCKFHENIAKNHNIENVLKSLSKNDLLIKKILKFGDIDATDEAEKSEIEKKRMRAIDNFKTLIQIVLEFYQRHHIAYNKVKHGNSLFYNLDTQIIGSEKTYIIPVSYNSKEIEKTEILLLNKTIYEKTWTLFGYLSDFLRLVCHINKDFIEHYGKEDNACSIIILDENDFKYLMRKYSVFTDDSVDDKLNVDTRVLLTINEKKITDLFNFYTSLP